MMQPLTEAQMLLGPILGAVVTRDVRNNIRQNDIDNCDLIGLRGGIEEYRGAFEGQAVIVVAAGPSLNRNGSILRDVQGKIPILAVDAAWPILRHHGIVPDFMMVMEASTKVNQFWVEGYHGNTMMLAITHANPSVLNTWKGPLRFWGMPGLDNYNVGSLAQGGSVVTALYSFAGEWGLASTIILVGCDFSYRPGQYYADGGIDHLAPQDVRTTLIIDNNGDEVVTLGNLFHYRRWMELRALFLADTLGTRTINATEGGILRLDETMRLQAAIKEVS